MSDFHVGQKVVCLHGGGWYSSIWRTRLIHRLFGRHVRDPKKGPVYTITGITTAGYLFLSDCESSYSYNYKCFRPLEEKPDAIEWARKICLDVTAGKMVRIPARKPIPLSTD
jgi:hypothetical protein